MRVYALGLLGIGWIGLWNIYTNTKQYIQYINTSTHGHL